jgi:hypothetical protein
VPARDGPARETAAGVPAVRLEAVSDLMRQHTVGEVRTDSDFPAGAEGGPVPTALVAVTVKV